MKTEGFSIATAVSTFDLKDVTIRGIWRFLGKQPLSFWLVCTYIFFEYVRPQQVYPAIDVLPWAQSILIAATIAFLLEGRGFRFRTSGGVWLLAFTGIVLASSVTAFSPSIAYEDLELFLTWVLVFVLITNTVTTENRYFVVMLLFLLCSFKMSQHGARSWAQIGFGFRDWGATGGPGWFHNSGEFGIQMCIFLPLSVAFLWAGKERWGRWKRSFFWLFPITALMSIIASSSRGAVIGATAVALWWVLFVSRRFKAVVITAAVASAVYMAIPPEQKARFEAVGEDETSEARLTRWEDGIEIMNQRPLFGVGYRNWSAYYQAHFPQRERHGLSHNIFIDAGSELGYSGLIAFLALIASCFRLNWKTRRLADRPMTDGRFLYATAYGLDGALVGLLVSGSFVSVLYYPYFWIHLALVVSLHVATKNKVRAVRLALQQEKKRQNLGAPVRNRLREPAAAISRSRLSTQRST